MNPILYDWSVLDLTIGLLLHSILTQNLAAARHNKHVLSHTVLEGYESRSAPVVWFWLKVSHELSSYWKGL